MKKGGCLKFIFISIAVVFILGVIGSLLRSEKKEGDKKEVITKTPEEQAESDSLLKDNLEKINKEIDKMKPLFRSSKDEFTGITWIENKGVSKYADSNAFYTYIGIPESGVPYERLVIRYFGSSWLFINKIIIKVDDDLFTINSSKVERDNNSNVWEWIDVSPTDEQTSMIALIINSKETKIRFDGKQYSKDWTLKQKDIKALSETQKYFSLLSEKSRIERKIEKNNK